MHAARRYQGLDALATRFFAAGSLPFLLTKLLLDLSIFGALHVLGFFTYLTLAEGGSWQVGWAGRRGQGGSTAQA